MNKDHMSLLALLEASVYLQNIINSCENTVNNYGNKLIFLAKTNSIYFMIWFNVPFITVQIILEVVVLWAEETSTYSC